MPMKIGYIRVSTQEQNTVRQEDLMERLGVELVYMDKMSGKARDRPALQTMMGFVRAGDTVVVESISRFARNTRDLLELIEQLREKGVEFQSQKEAIDTTTLVQWLSWNESISFSVSGKGLRSQKQTRSTKAESPSNEWSSLPWSGNGGRERSRPQKP